MKKIMLFVLSAVMSLSFCACGGSGSSGTSKSTSKPNSYSSGTSDSSTSKSNSYSSGASKSTSKSNSYSSGTVRNTPKSSSSSKKKSSSSSYDYDKGYGYTEPKKGESLSDYIKRQDPELYNDMKKNYDNATKNYKKSK